MSAQILNLGIMSEQSTFQRPLPPYQEKKFLYSYLVKLALARLIGANSS